MGFNLSNILIFVTGALAGIVGALKVIAPRTRNTKDDWVLEKAEQVLEILPHEAPGIGKK